MPSTVTTKCAGLWLQPNDVASVPDGALSVADNVVISRDDICETRRGYEVKASKALSRLFSFKGYLVGFGGSILSRSLDEGATWADYAGSFAAPSGYAMRSAELSSNLYVTTSQGVQRLDAIDGTPEAAGAPAGLDAQAVLAGAGTAQPADSQVGYRVLWGKRDANSNVILGAPSARATATNAAGGSTQNVTVSTTIPQGVTGSHFWQIYRTPPSVDDATDPGDEEGLIYEATAPAAATVTSLSRASNVVTATTSTAHGFSVGQTVRVGPGGQVPGALTAIGYNVAATSSDGSSWSARTITSKTWTAIAYNGSVAVAVGLGSAAATSPDGITWTTRTIPAGDYYAVAWNGSVFAAVGASVCATSPDGTTWTARSIPAATYKGLAWNGSLFAAVGGTGATSPDGITWTARAMPANGSYSAYAAIASNGSVFAAVGNNVAASSPDGVNWTLRAVPSGGLNAVTANGSAFVAIGNAGLAATSSDGATWTQRSAPSASYFSVDWGGTYYVAVGQNACATSPDGITWTSRSIPAGNYNAITVAQTSATFYPGERTVASVPDTTHFTYSETGSNGSITAPQNAQPLTVAATISTPPAFSGAALYTNETQQGIMAQNDAPPVARDVTSFRGMMVYANVTDAAYLQVSLLAAGGSLGVQTGDTVTINGVTWTAGASESIPGHTFQIGTSGLPAKDIADTAASLIRVINRTGSSPVYARDVSDPTSVPGVIRFTARSLTDSITLAVSRSSSWSLTGGTSAAPKTSKNMVGWTKKLQPDAAPVIYRQPVGSADHEVLRVIPTRDSVFVLKEQDGVFRFTGDSPEAIRIDPFDINTNLVASETAVALDNKVFMLSQQGVVAVTDTGVELVSRAIEPALIPFGSGPMRDLAAQLAFGIGVESDRKYILFLPTVSTDTTCTQAFVFDLITRGWTRWDLTASHGISLGADDHIYLVDGQTVRRERKDCAITDYADETYPVTINSVNGTAVTLANATNAHAGDVLSKGAFWAVIVDVTGNVATLDQAGITVGAATVYRAISTDVEWVPKFASPGMMHLFSEASLAFRSAFFARATLAFATDMQPTLDPVDLATDWTSVMDHPVVRVAIPRNESRGGMLRVRYSHAQAWSPNQIQALSVTYVPGTAPVRRPSVTVTGAPVYS